MRYSIVLTTLAAGASAHGVIRNVVGANGVSMPGLGVADGTPRNCAANACGAQADTCIIRDADIAAGKSPLGWTQGNGEVKAESLVASFMGKGGNVPTNQGTSGSTGVEDNIPANILSQQRKQRREEHMNEMRGMFSGLFNLPVIGVLGLGGKPNDYPFETIVGDMAGQGAEKGMPTCGEDGKVSLIYRQINQDGAGPLTAAVDASSGGTDGSAFKSASLPLNIPGIGISGLSIATNTDFPITVQLPEGTVCTGEIAGYKNICVIRVRNEAFAGPFGGAAICVQSDTARKRAIAYRLKKRFEFNREAEE
ncbi:hypothetical protein MY3296_008405 [Beauveria thailandica]